MSFPALHPWQYRLTFTDSHEAIPIGKLWLAVGPDLPVTHLTDDNGKAVGILLGFPIDLKARRLISDVWQVPAKLNGDVDAFVRKGLLALGGTFLWIFCAQNVTRIYPNCSAQIPCVFDPVMQVVGSTAHALLDDAEYDARFNKALFDYLGVDGQGWFPAGLTAHDGLIRLLPNHYLDLDSWTVKRSWFGPKMQTDNPSEVVEECIEIIQAQIEALINGPKRVAMALTAGRDSRMLLACARPFLDQLDFATVVVPDRQETDTVMALRIAAKFGLPHLSLERTVADPQQRALFMRRGGHCYGDSNSRFHPSIWPLAESHVMVSGVGGEAARAFFWRDTDSPQTPLTAAGLTARFGLRKNAALTERLEGWLDVLQGTNTLHMLDLAYHEHLNGSWAGVQFCSDPTLVRQGPLMTTRMAELMMQLPGEWHKTSRLHNEIIIRKWPELGKLPYNTLGFFHNKFGKLRKAVKKPKLVMKVIRKRHG